MSSITRTSPSPDVADALRRAANGERLGRQRISSRVGRQLVRDAAKLMRSQSFDDVLTGRQMLFDVLTADAPAAVLLDAAHLAITGHPRPRVKPSEYARAVAGRLGGPYDRAYVA